MAAAGKPAPADLTDEPVELAERGAAAPAREVPARQGRRLGSQLRGRGDRHAGGAGVRGQRADVPDPAGGAGLGGRHREGAAHVGRPRRLPPAAAALLDRRADEPLHLHVDRGHPRRRAAGGARGAARQRPHQARWPTRSAARRCAASAARPASTCARSTSASAGTPTARSTRARSARSSTRCSRAWARTRRSTRCPTPRPCAARASRSARCASTSPRCWCTCASKVVDAHRGDLVPKPEAIAMKATGAAFASSGRLRLAERFSGLAGRVLRRESRPPGSSGWTGARDLPVPAKESFRAWWKRTDGGTPRVPDARARRSWRASAPRPSEPSPPIGPCSRPRDRSRSSCSWSGWPTTAPWSRRVRRTSWPTSSPRPCPGTRSWCPQGLGFEVPGAVVDDGLTSAELDGIDAVVTEARVGIAETGTIVLDHGAGQGRRAITLVPDHHICVVRQDQVVADVPDAVALPRPPATADLDQRTLGHERHRAGPGRGRARPSHTCT